MRMRIAGVGNNSFVDYPGKIAMVIFIEGCNFNCYYCHNRAILRKNSSNVIYAPDMLLANLVRKKNFLDGVVISGGEPTAREKLPEFVESIKKATGLSVKLDTNGTNPDMLKELIKKKLVDYVAMDIKAPKDKYNKICLCKVDLDAIQKSIDIDAAVTNEDLSPVTGWLKENIHKHGMMFSPDELLRQSTGEPFNPKYYVDYLSEKFTELYLQ